ncbi:MAG: hypothetical protein PHF36_06805 [Candidatus Cloacimonetes bacterium]|jgi:uncharacterized protein YqeY|nr:hypothetical protein [Candidatus Cloacimonadota bacterium]
MDKKMKLIAEVLGNLDEKKDFYLRFLITNEGKEFMAEELYEQREKYLGNLKEDAIFCTINETGIPVMDETTRAQIMREINKKNERKSVYIEYKRDDLVKIIDKEIDELFAYINKNTNRQGEIRNFPTSQSKMRESILKAIRRSVNKLKKVDVKMSEMIALQVNSSMRATFNELL